MPTTEEGLVEVDHGGTDSPPSLQRKVTDLTSRLDEMEKLLRTLVDEKPAKEESEPEEENDNSEKPDDEDDAKANGDGTHKDNATDVENTDSDDKDDEKFNCEPAWKLRYVRPKTDWRSELVTDDSVGKEAAIVVYYEYPEGSTSHPDEPPAGILPVRIRISSFRLDRLLEDATGLRLPPLPYTALPPYKVFVSHYEKLKETLGDLEISFAIDSNTTVDSITSEMLGAPPWPPETRDDPDSNTKSFENKKRDIVLLRCFIDMSERFLGPLIDLKSRIANKTLESISFANLWFLYQPGDIIFGQDSVGSKKYNAYRVFCVTGGRPCLRCLSHAQTVDHKQHGPGFSDLKLHCYSWRYNGSRFTPSTTTKYIPMFDGEQKIKDLPYFPKQLYDSNDPVLSKLVARGNRFQSCRFGHGTYNGTTLPPNSWHINEDVFIDFRSGYEFNPEWRDDSDETLPLPDRDDKGTWESRCSVDDCEAKSCNSWNISDEALNFEHAARFIAKKEYILEFADDDLSGLDEDKLVMLPPALLGYGLRSKEWFYLDPEIFELISTSAEKRQQAFNDLVLPPRTKNLLKAMVKTHAAMMQDSQAKTAEFVDEIDLVKGKGKGLIIFLYGPPGVGKTSTAETIAAYSTPARPLYPITCGDLGSDPVAIQANLDSHFTLAHRWNCVLLLDEADVYLAERDIHDLSRNGIVSVFLRNLEYYSGILFLTSNREGLIDEAFKSRIHVALRYKAIDMKGTEQIWRNIMRKIREENAKKKLPVTFDTEDLVEWAMEHFEENSTRRADSASSTTSTATWNGRQIRNAFQTAIALASFSRLERLEKKGLSETQAMEKNKPKYSEIQLTRAHFDTVAKVVGEFEDYLVECRGDDGERAEKELWRKDSHDPNAQRDSAYRTPKANGTPKKVLGNRFRNDADDMSHGGFMSSPAPKRRAKGKEADVEEEQSERPSRNAGREQSGWRSRKAKEEEVDESSDTD